MMYSFITVLCCDDWLVSVCCLEWISDYGCGTRLTGTVRAAVGTVAVSLCVTVRARACCSLFRVEPIIRSVTVGCGRSNKSTEYYKTNKTQKITVEPWIASHNLF
jgi:hypothetical protein